MKLPGFLSALSNTLSNTLSNEMNNLLGNNSQRAQSQNGSIQQNLMYMPSQFPPQNYQPYNYQTQANQAYIPSQFYYPNNQNDQNSPQPYAVIQSVPYYQANAQLNQQGASTQRQLLSAVGYNAAGQNRSGFPMNSNQIQTNHYQTNFQIGKNTQQAQHLRQGPSPAVLPKNVEEYEVPDDESSGRNRQINSLDIRQRRHAKISSMNQGRSGNTYQLENGLKSGQENSMHQKYTNQSTASKLQHRLSNTNASPYTANSAFAAAANSNKNHASSFNFGKFLQDVKKWAGNDLAKKNAYRACKIWADDKNLEKPLNLSYNFENCKEKLTDLFPIPEGIKKLNVSGHKLTSIDPPKSMQELDFSENKVTKFKGGPNLKKLICNSNELKELEVEEGTKFVDAKFNHIETFCFRKSLDDVDLYSNALKSLENVKYAEKIDSCMIGYNMIPLDKVNEYSEIIGKSKAVEIGLTGSDWNGQPVQSSEGYDLKSGFTNK